MMKYLINLLKICMRNENSKDDYNNFRPNIVRSIRLLEIERETNRNLIFIMLFFMLFIRVYHHTFSSIHEPTIWTINSLSTLQTTNDNDTDFLIGILSGSITKSFTSVQIFKRESIGCENTILLKEEYKRNAKEVADIYSSLHEK